MKKVEPKTLSGFMELSPTDQILFNSMLDVIKTTYEQYGFLPLDTPIIESSEVLLAKAGGETEKQIYRFTKGDNDLSLRFDLTVPLAKYVASRYNDLILPFKRYQIGKVYRGERPQRGRFREFYQCDIDVIGDEVLPLMYDAEIPAIIYDIFRKMNIGDFVIRINNRKTLTGYLAILNVTNPVLVLRIIDKMDKIGDESTIEELIKLGLSNTTIKLLLTFIKTSGSNEEKLAFAKSLNINNSEFDLGISELETVINSLKTMGIPEDNYVVDFKLTRGLDYYTGTVYETYLKDYRELGSICGGGRYDNLADYYTDKKLPGVGIAIGLTRLFFQLKEAGLINALKGTTAEVFILPIEPNYEFALKVSKTLRDNNIPVSVIYLDKGLKQMMKYANRSNVPFVIIIGEDEIKTQKVTLRNMLTGEQLSLDIDQLLEYMSK